MLARAVGSSDKGGSSAVLPDVKMMIHGSRTEVEVGTLGMCKPAWEERV